MVTRVRVGKVIVAATLVAGACGGTSSVTMPSNRLVPATSAPSTVPTSVTVDERPPVDLHDVDWAAVLPTLSGVEVDPAQPPGPGPYVTSGVASGYADLRTLAYEDLSRDGHDEAVIGLTAGGEMGGTGLIVLTPGPNGPVLVPNDDMVRAFGYGTRFEAANGELLVTYFVGAGWEQPCCLSGQVQQRYRLGDGRMRLVSGPLEFGTDVAKGFTIDRYYRLIDARHYDAANQLLTETARARIPSEPWMDLFVRSTSVKAEIGSAPRPDGLTPFRLLVTGTDGVTQVWTGGYSLVYSTVQHQWLLDWFNLQYDNA